MLYHEKVKSQMIRNGSITWKNIAPPHKSGKEYHRVFFLHSRFCALGRTIFPYRNSIPFQIAQNKFFAINEKLFASYPRAKQFARSRAQIKKTLSGIFYLCPREESNLHQSLRRASFYPLNYGGKIFNKTYPIYYKCTVLPKHLSCKYVLRLWQFAHLISHFCISFNTDSHE